MIAFFTQRIVHQSCLKVTKTGGGMGILKRVEFVQFHKNQQKG